jgi:hypothetical protein
VDTTGIGDTGDSLGGDVKSTDPAKSHDAAVAELAGPEAQLSLIGQPPVDGASYNLPDGYGNQIKTIWLDLSETERKKFGDSFQKFLTDPNGLALQPGGDGQKNQLAVRTYLANVAGSDATLKGDLGKLDQLEHPTDKVWCGWSQTSDRYALIQDLWANLDADTRKSYGNDINKWIKDTPPKGLGFKNGDIVGNDAALDAYINPKPPSTAQPPSGTAPNGDSWSSALTAAKADNYASTTQKKDDLFAGNYLKMLRDKGFVGNPPPTASAGGASSGINPQTGDDMSAHVFAQNLPKGMKGGALASLADIDNMQKKADEDLQSMSEMSEMKMMKLQLLMDRRSKLLEAISNVMKKVSSTADNIIANVK